MKVEMKGEKCARNVESNFKKMGFLFCLIWEMMIEEDDGGPIQTVCYYREKENLKGREREKESW